MPWRSRGEAISRWLTDSIAIVRRSSSAALAQLALALAEMDHKPMAEDLLTLLAKRDFGEPSADAAGAEKRPAVGALEASIGSDSLPWSDAAAELRRTLCLGSRKRRRRIARRSSRRSIGCWPIAPGNRWAPDKATGPAIAALAQWFGKNRFDEEHYQTDGLRQRLAGGGARHRSQGRHANHRCRTAYAQAGQAAR